MEHYPEQYTRSKPIPLENMKRYITKEDAACKLITGKGTGFFCELKLNNNTMKVLLTCNHILTEDLIKNNSKITLKYQKQIKEIKINEKRFVCTNEELDYTCIQILNEDNINDYFQIDTNINKNPNEIYNNELFAIYQCPELNDLSLLEGKIEEFKSNGLILHNISTDGGSSGGALILSKNLNVIGIHRGKSVNELNQAIFIKNVLDDIIQQLSKKKSNIYPKETLQIEGKIFYIYFFEQYVDNNYKCFKCGSPIPEIDMNIPDFPIIPNPEIPMILVPNPINMRFMFKIPPIIEKKFPNNGKAKKFEMMVCNNCKYEFVLVDFWN